MKKIYAYALTTVMALAGTVGASAAAPLSRDARTAQHLAETSAKTLDAASRISQQPTRVETAFSGLDAARKATRTATGRAAAFDMTSGVRPFRAPAAQADGEWTSVGTGRITDGIMTAVFGMPVYSWEVEVEQNAANPKLYRFVNPYTCKASPYAAYAADASANAYFTVDLSTEGKARFVNGQSYDGIPMWPINIKVDEEDGEFALGAEEAYPVVGGNITIPAEESYVYGLNSYDQGYWFADEIVLALPGAKDYTVTVSAPDYCVEVGQNLNFSVYAGADVATTKLFIANGMFTDTEANLNVVAQSGQPVQSGNYSLPLSSAGWYTIFVVGLDADGNRVSSALCYAWGNQFVAANWNLIGTAKFTDDTFGPIYDVKDALPAYDVEVYESKTTPGLVALKNPYENSPLLNTDMKHGHDDYVQIDASNAAAVSIDRQPIGVTIGGQGIALFSIKEGTMKDRVITFPTKGLAVDILGEGAYYANQFGRFKVQLPVSVTVNVTDGENPVEGANVSLLGVSGEPVATDAEGHASFSLIPTSNTLTVTAYKDGLELVSNVTLTLTNALTYTANLLMREASCTLHVITVDNEGEPVPAVNVYVGGVTGEYVTDETGKLDITLPGSTIGKEVAVELYKDGYEPWAGTADFSEGMEATVIGTLAAAEATLHVIASDSEGEPVAAVNVYFNGGEYTTDEAGKLDLTLSAPAVIGKEFSVELYKDGYEPFTGTANFTEGLEAYVIAELQAAEATLHVIATDAEGEPVAAVNVYFNGGEYTTDEAGKLDLTLSAPTVIGKSLPVELYKDGYEPFNGTADFTEGFDAYVIAALQAAEATLHVIATDAEGEPVAAVNVYFNGGEYTTDEAGKLDLTLSAPAVIGKEFSVELYKDGYEPFTGTADFTEGLEAYVIAALTEIECTAHVTVVSAADGEPIAGATVTISFGDQEYTAITEYNGVAKATLPGKVLGTKVPFTVKANTYLDKSGEIDFTEGMEGYAVIELVSDPVSLDMIVADGEANGVKYFDANGRQVTPATRGLIIGTDGSKFMIRK